MLSEHVRQALTETISEATGTGFQLTKLKPLSGGSINSSCQIEGSAGGASTTFFAKFNHSNLFDMFVAESLGLDELRKTKAIRVPEPVCCGQAAEQSWLVTEFVQFGRHSDKSDQLTGKKLAALHGHTAENFGWQRNNYIGSTSQLNEWSESWVAFFRNCRLGPQLRLAADKGVTGNLHGKGEILMSKLDLFFLSYKPEPSLLHGDLWAGNCAFDLAGRPVIFDPAVYYGDREADVAMTELFGGFSSYFYDAYESEWPLDAGFGVRKILYNLYHILNHANLFGGGYGTQAEGMMDCLLSEV